MNDATTTRNSARTSMRNASQLVGNVITRIATPPVHPPRLVSGRGRTSTSLAPLEAISKDADERAHVPLSSACDGT